MHVSADSIRSIFVFHSYVVFIHQNGFEYSAWVFLLEYCTFYIGLLKRFLFYCSNSIHSRQVKRLIFTGDSGENGQHFQASRCKRIPHFGARNPSSSKISGKSGLAKCGCQYSIQLAKYSVCGGHNNWTLLRCNKVPMLHFKIKASSKGK